MKHILFTGATGGLGKLCVEALSGLGYTVFAIGTAQAKLTELGSLPHAIPIEADVTKAESIDSARKKVLACTNRLDAVVNFAGASSFCSMIEGDSVNIAERLLDVNVMGTVRINRAFFDLVHAGGGRIINCSSEAGWMKPQPFAAPYFMSKRAVEAYNDSLRRELAYLGVPVIKIQPGSYKTKLTDKILDEFDRTLKETMHYGKILTRMKPLMVHELSQGNDPRKLVKTVIRAIEDKRPKLKYRVGTGKLLALLEVMPDRWVDSLYKWLAARKTKADASENNPF